MVHIGLLWKWSQILIEVTEQVVHPQSDLQSLTITHSNFETPSDS